MCNLYSLTTTRAAMVRLRRALQGELPLELMKRGRVYPDQDAPVIAVGEGGVEELRTMRWGFPPPKGATSRQVTNVRNLASPYWRGALKRPWRCLVPFTAFAEPGADGPVWFGRPGGKGGAGGTLACFAGVWRHWRGERLVKIEGQERRVRAERDFALFAFLTCPPNAVVAPVHPKAMPVILTEPDEMDLWLHGADDLAPALARPLDDQRLAILDAA